MVEGQALDLGHTIPLAVNPASRGDRIEHAACNRGAAGRERQGTSAQDAR